MRLLGATSGDDLMPCSDSERDDDGNCHAGPQILGNSAFLAWAIPAPATGPQGGPEGCERHELAKGICEHSSGNADRHRPPGMDRLTAISPGPTCVPAVPAKGSVLVLDLVLRFVWPVSARFDGQSLGEEVADQAAEHCGDNYPPQGQLACCRQSHRGDEQAVTGKWREDGGPHGQVRVSSTDGGRSRSGTSSVSMSRTRPSMSAMMLRTVSSSWPPGSATGQSTYFTPGT